MILSVARVEAMTEGDDEAVNINGRLEKRTSTYALVFAALCAIAGGGHDMAAVAELLAAEDDDPNDLEALDATWQETAVTFGPDPNAGCPAVRETLAKMTPPPTQPGEPG